MRFNSKQWAKSGLVLFAMVVFLGVAMAAKDEESVGDLMERVHRGRRSPLRQLDQQLSADKPQWSVVDQQLPAFGRMADALKRSRKESVRDAADGYADSVSELAKSARVRNLMAARKAFKSLNDSCADCHYKGGPGGKLDDD